MAPKDFDRDIAKKSSEDILRQELGGKMPENDKEKIAAAKKLVQGFKSEKDAKPDDNFGGYLDGRIRILENGIIAWEEKERPAQHRHSAKHHVTHRAPSSPRPHGDSVGEKRAKPIEKPPVKPAMDAFSNRDLDGAAKTLGLEDPKKAEAFKANYQKAQNVALASARSFGDVSSIVLEKMARDPALAPFSKDIAAELAAAGNDEARLGQLNAHIMGLKAAVAGAGKIQPHSVPSGTDFDGINYKVEMKSTDYLLGAHVVPAGKKVDFMTSSEKIKLDLNLGGRMAPEAFKALTPAQEAQAKTMIENAFSSKPSPVGAKP